MVSTRRFINYSSDTLIFKKVDINNTKQIDSRKCGQTRGNDLCKTNWVLSNGVIFDLRKFNLEKKNINYPEAQKGNDLEFIQCDCTFKP